MHKLRVQSGEYNAQVQGTMYKWRVQCTSEEYNVQVFKVYLLPFLKVPMLERALKNEYYFPSY